MAHALREFIRTQMDARNIDQATLTRSSGLTRSHVSKLLKDDRDRLPQIPKRDTLAGLAKAFNLSEQVVLAVAVEALGLGYSAEDFVYGLGDATDAELTSEIDRRLRERAAPGALSGVGTLTAGTSRAPAAVTLNATRVLSAAEEILANPDLRESTKLLRLLKAARDETAHGRVDIAFMDSVLLEATALELARAEDAEDRRKVIEEAEKAGIRELAKAARNVGKATTSQQYSEVLAALGEESQTHDHEGEDSQWTDDMEPR